MRIVYLINGLNGGGAAFPMIQIIGLMRDLGHEVSVLALMRQDGRAAQRLELAGIPYELIGHGRHDFVAPAMRLIRRLKQAQPDVLWTSLTRGTIYGQLAGWHLGIPVVSWQHSAYLKPGNIAILRRLAALTTRWVADSESVRDFAQRALAVSAERIAVWTPFIAALPLDAIKPWNEREPLRLGTLGRLHVSKQYAVLIKAFARALAIDPLLATKLELHIAGDGPDRAALIFLTRNLGLQRSVHFYGFVDRPGKFLATLHAYIQTSRKEGFCIAAHEAMQAGLPVIATRVGELASSVQPGQTGWLCDVGDVESLARAMLDFARNPGRAAQMGRKAREWIHEKYSPGVFRDTGRRLLEDVQRELLAKRASTR